MRFLISCAALCGVCLLGLIIWHAEKNAVPTVLASGYSPIPPGFDFPGNQQTFIDWSNNQKMADMRRHGWYLWAGINQPARDGQLVWQTWWSITQAMASKGNGELGAQQSRGNLINSNLKNVRKPGARMSLKSGMPGLITPACEAKIVEQPCYGKWDPNKKSCVDPANGDGARFADNGDIMIAGEYYDKAAFDHIRNNKLYLASSLNPKTGRSVPLFPRESVVLKSMYWPVRGDGLTALPVWDNSPTNPVPGYNGYETWRRAVAIDPTRTTIPKGETATVTYLYGVTTVNINTGVTTPHKPITFHDAKVVPVSAFYNHRVTEEEWKAMDPGDKKILNQSAQWTYNRDFRPGDYIVNIAMHIITKEMPDWAMQTFWWHDKPDDGPFAENRPANAPAGTWRHYLMCTAWNMDTPHEYDGTPFVCSNPYIELVVPEACRISTNCQNCHTRAAWPTQSVQPQGGAHYDTSRRGYIPENDPIFHGLKRTDFQWAVADRAHQ